MVRCLPGMPGNQLCVIIADEIGGPASAHGRRYDQGFQGSKQCFVAIFIPERPGGLPVPEPGNKIVREIICVWQAPRQLVDFHHCGAVFCTSRPGLQEYSKKAIG